jgi:hypothetical protein
MDLGLEVKAREYRIEDSTFLGLCFPILGTWIGVGRLKFGGQLAGSFGIGICTAKITLTKETDYHRSWSLQARRTGSVKITRAFLSQSKTEFKKDLRNTLRGAELVNILKTMRLEV